jgi:hypothetical protein
MTYRTPPKCPHAGKIEYEDMVEAERWAGLWELKYNQPQYPHPCIINGEFKGHFHTSTRRNKKRKSRKRNALKKRNKARLQLALAIWETDGGKPG